MSEQIPQSLKAGHEALRATLKRAMREPGKTGEAARKLASIVDGHFLREEKFIMPLLALLPGLARGQAGADAASAVHHVESLRSEMQSMIADHRQISDVLHSLAAAAEAEGKPDYVGFAEEMVMHAHLEEDVLYPAALVAGEFVKKLRGG